MKLPDLNNALGVFRMIAWAEGVSFLLLLLIAMPLKYFAGLPLAVKYFGWIHGILFILYLRYGLKLMLQNNWGIKKSLLALGAALVPLGPFIFDKKILNHENELIK